MKRALLLVVLLAHPSLAQIYGGEEVIPHFSSEDDSPQLHKWYGPRHLPETYTQPWYYFDTRYDTEYYRRYINRQLEGREFFDAFGRSLGLGWQVYTWSQAQPGARGSLIDKKRRFNVGGASQTAFNTYTGFFGNLVVAAERGRHGAWALLVGDEVSTYFTPLTFAKPRFNGVRLDWTAERGSATLLLSRPSQPDDQEQSNATHLLGGHAQFQAGPQATLGLTYVNAHNVQTQFDFTEGNLLHGALTSSQNQPLEKLWVRVRDDSPGKGEIGARLAGFDIVLTDTSGRQVRGSQIGLMPRVTGETSQDSRLMASDAESIQLEYDLDSLKTGGFDTGALAQVQVELALANDYRVEMASNLQTDGERFNPEIIFLPFRRAAGNVQDNTNTRVLKLDYGLPVGNELLGLDWNLVKWKGLSAQGELVLNRRFRNYPNPLRTRYHQSVDRAQAGYAHLAYQRHFLTFFSELFFIDDGYSTAYWLTDSNGQLKYKNPIPQVYEFVEDDDDQNSRPEWQRPFAPAWSQVAWPGYDENQDFLNDHDQNANQVPDYDEPFLRFTSDRPEFLFGLDMNYNGWVDRFENDDLPDYPYQADHRGFNAYWRLEPTPELSLMAGCQQEKLVAGDGRAKAWYGLGIWAQPLRGGGRLRFIVHGARMRDDIPDPLIQWFQPLNTPGVMRQVRDLMPGQNTWKGVLYGDADERLGPGLRLQHRFKWEYWRQLDDREALRARGVRSHSEFLGVIDKATWQLPLGQGTLEPRWKNEFRRDRPFDARLSPATSLEETGILLWTQPLMAEHTRVNYFARYGRQLFATELQLGLERHWFWLLSGQREDADRDFSSWTWVAQCSNRTAYQGYQLVTRLGVEFEHRRASGQPTRWGSVGFLSINAGLR